MILSAKATTVDYNSVSQAISNESKKWELQLNEELKKMVYMQLYNRLRRENLSKVLLQIIASMNKVKLW